MNEFDQAVGRKQRGAQDGVNLTQRDVVAAARRPSRSPIAEKCGGDNNCLGQLIEPKSRCADFDSARQHNVTRARLRQGGSDREPRNVASVAEGEHRHTLDIGAKAKARSRSLGWNVDPQGFGLRRALWRWQTRCLGVQEFQDSPALCGVPD